MKTFTEIREYLVEGHDMQMSDWTRLDEHTEGEEYSGFPTWILEKANPGPGCAALAFQAFPWKDGSDKLSMLNCIYGVRDTTPDVVLTIYGGGLSLVLDENEKVKDYSFARFDDANQFTWILTTQQGDGEYDDVLIAEIRISRYTRRAGTCVKMACLVLWALMDGAKQAKTCERIIFENHVDL